MFCPLLAYANATAHDVDAIHLVNIAYPKYLSHTQNLAYSMVYGPDSLVPDDANLGSLLGKLIRLAVASYSKSCWHHSPGCRTSNKNFHADLVCRHYCRMLTRNLVNGDVQTLIDSPIQVLGNCKRQTLAGQSCLPLSPLTKFLLLLLAFSHLTSIVRDLWSKTTLLKL